MNNPKFFLKLSSSLLFPFQFFFLLTLSLCIEKKKNKYFLNVIESIFNQYLFKSHIYCDEEYLKQQKRKP